MLALTLLATGPRPSLAMGPPRGNTASSPFDLKDPEVVRQGGRLFQQSCTGYCHGKEGRLSRAPALRGRDFDPAYLFGRIANGGNAPMPAFQAVLAPEDIWRLVAYILSLSEAKD